MDNKTFAKLVGDLREDKKLFHAFIFEPDTALKKLAYLDDSSKRMLQAIDPRSFIADAAGLLDRATLACGPDTTCSCTKVDSCGLTCGGGGTCGGSSCDYTCSFTTNFGAGFRDLDSLRSFALNANHVWDDTYIAWK